MITHPEYLSKDRLKSDLKSHGIKYNHNENKQYYVQLYHKHLMQEDHSRTEFSSDEEFVKRASKQEKKQKATKKRKSVKLDTYLPDVLDLPDSELLEELRGYGEDCGPITDSTRGVYQRKLAKLMAEKATGKSTVPRDVQPPDSSEDDDEANTAKNESYIGEWSSEEESENDDHRNETVEELRKPVDKTPHPTIVGKGGRQSGLRERPRREQGYERPVPKSSGAPPSAASREQPAGSSSSFLCSFLLLIVMFAVAFLAYEHYTSSEGKPSLVVRSWDKFREVVVNYTPEPAPTPTPQQAPTDEPTKKPPSKPVKPAAKTADAVTEKDAKADKPKASEKAAKPSAPKGKASKQAPTKKESPKVDKQPAPKGASKPSQPKQQASKQPSPPKQAPKDTPRREQASAPPSTDPPADNA